MMSLAIGSMIGEGWEAAPRWLFSLSIILVFAWLVSAGNTMRAEHRLELSIEERDQYREQRWQELHQEELLELHDTVVQLRQQLADHTPHVH